jgi:hypothetical protein
MVGSRVTTFRFKWVCRYELGAIQVHALARAARGLLVLRWVAVCYSSYCIGLLSRHGMASQGRQGVGGAGCGWEGVGVSL